ncbi:MAG: hypothetical protein IH840_11215 [Candidatus Heimdallarchaeota archaeon]|nr:hypothetical protein [Candidatus Heimdallarchaeota archaeon]
MNIFHIHKLVIFNILCLIIGNVPIVSHQVNSEDLFIDYTISGKLLVVGVGEFNGNGGLHVTISEKNRTSLRYHLEYIAAISDYEEEGEADLVENNLTKILDEITDSNVIIKNLWDIYSNEDNNEVYSIFHLSVQEVENDFVHILNYTSTIEGEIGFFSPNLGFRIQSYKVRIDGRNSDVLLFYDVKNLQLVGLSVVVFLEIETGQQILFDIRMVISDSNLIFEAADSNLIQSVIVPLILVTLVVIILLLNLNFQRKKNEITMDGGL